MIQDVDLPVERFTKLEVLYPDGSRFFIERAGYWHRNPVKRIVIRAFEFVRGTINRARHERKMKAWQTGS